MGGRRRRSVKKTRKMKGGNFYSVVGGDPELGGAGARVDAVPNLGLNGNGTPVDGGDYMMPQLGARRRRTGKKTRKGGRKSRASRASRKGRKTMRGGAGFYSIAGAGASYGGQGIAGMADYGGYSTKGPVTGGPTQGGDGVMHV